MSETEKTLIFLFILFLPYLIIFLQRIWNKRLKRKAFEAQLKIIGKLILEDDKVSQFEAEVLWDVLNSKEGKGVSKPFKALYIAVKEAMADGVLDVLEADEIQVLLGELLDKKIEKFKLASVLTMLREMLETEKIWLAVALEKYANKTQQEHAKKQYEKSVLKADGLTGKPTINAQLKEKAQIQKTQSTSVQKSKISALTYTLVPDTEIEMLYEDSQGQVSLRSVKVLDISRKNGRTYIDGICLERKAWRTFRADRVLNFTDKSTGELVTNVLSAVA